ncbi:hypothetical protein BDV38DRAFT_283736 [Aspergillus pseudotamarii]|uniref:Uncharacterized protein n=1 Tax=Aspergillus pseudotamarii TaxID=132259 RepID=A0A5N6SQ27_ASPPS|nr:uncharacterized protein BDV38DRAFT_283736 [Aspergillus pseudotamarii]KAE8136798.1 hypothetical protein BDV38DRAFT_283736 [Aspergillus pseudotamarii]
MSAAPDDKEWEDLVDKHLTRLSSRKRKKFAQVIQGLNQNNFEQTLCSLKNTAHSRKSNQWFEALEGPLTRLNSFAEAIKTLVSVSPNPAGFLWGTIQALITYALNYTSTMSTFAQLLSDLTMALPVFERYIQMLKSTQQLRIYLRELYDKYVGVCVDAFIFYHEWRWWKLHRTILKPIKETLQKAKQDIDGIVRNFEREAHVGVCEEVVTEVNKIQEQSPLIPTSNYAQKPFIVPYSQNTIFVGRTKELEDIHKQLKTNPNGLEHRNVCIVYSMGGVGKTQFAIQYTYQFKSEYDYIFWLDASDETTLSRDFAAIARRTGQSDRDPAEPQSLPIEVSKAKRWLEETSRRWLLVYDNFETWAITKPYWPSGSHGSILVTTQHSYISHISSHPPLELKVLDRTQGGELLLCLLHRLENQTMAVEEISAARQISEMLGGLPVAISHMAGYIQETHCSLQEFIEMYTKRQESQIIWEGGRDPHYQYSRALPTVWEVALNELSPEARRIINVVSMLSPSHIPEAMLFGDSGHHEMKLKSKQLLRSLHSRQLVKREMVDNQGYWSIHRSLQLHLLHLLDKAPYDRQSAFEEAVDIVRRAYPRQSSIQAPSNHNWELQEACLPHVVHLQNVFENAPPSDSEMTLAPSQNFVHLLGDLGNYMWERALYDKGVATLELAEKIYETQTWDDLIEHSKVATILGVLSQEIGISGRQQGLDRCRKSLALRKRHMANLRNQNIPPSRDEKLLFANAFNDVACSLLEYACYNQAKGYLDESISIKCSLDLPENGTAFFNFAENFKNLAIVRLAQKQPDEAMRLIERATTLMEANVGVHAATTQSFLFHRANILYCTGKYANALDAHESVLQARMEIFGERAHTLNSYFACGLAYRALGDLKNARARLEKCVDLHEAVYWPSECKARAGYALGSVLQELVNRGEADHQTAQALLAEARERKDALEANHKHALMAADASLSEKEAEAARFDHLVSFEAGRGTIGVLWGEEVHNTFKCLRALDKSTLQQGTLTRTMEEDKASWAVTLEEEYNSEARKKPWLDEVGDDVADRNAKGYTPWDDSTVDPVRSPNDEGDCAKGGAGTFTG